MQTWVLLIFGGPSTEHEISQRSARNILTALRAAGYGVRIVGYTRSGAFLPFPLEDSAVGAADWEERVRAELRARGGAGRELRLGRTESVSLLDFFETLAGGPFDCIFPAVHGINCEDGVLQGLMALSGRAFVGSGVGASALCMDKDLTRAVLRDTGFHTLPYQRVLRADYSENSGQVIERLEQSFPYPLFVKPANGGSSVGTAKAPDRVALRQALEMAFAFDHKLLVEPFIPATELEVAVLGNDRPVAAPVGRITVQTDGAFYDYASKYESDEAAQVEVPASIDELVSERLRETALRIYSRLGCQGLARVDFFQDKRDGTIYFNEVNTLPGFTAISVYPQAFQSVGYSATKLVRELVEAAFASHQDHLRRTERSVT